MEGRGCIRPELKAILRHCARGWDLHDRQAATHRISHLSTWQKPRQSSNLSHQELSTSAQERALPCCIQPMQCIASCIVRLLQKFEVCEGLHTPLCAWAVPGRLLAGALDSSQIQCAAPCRRLKGFSWQFRTADLLAACRRRLQEVMPLVQGVAGCMLVVHGARSSLPVHVPML